ncbi:MAG: magnesium transporter [Fuerstiella sp.]
MTEQEVIETENEVTAESMDAWKTLESIVEAQDSDAAHDFLKTLPPGETVRVITQLSEPEQLAFVDVLEARDAATLMETLPELQAAQILSALPAEQVAQIFHELDSDDQVDLLEQLSGDQSEAILEEMPEKEAENVRFLAQYDKDCAGGLMNMEYLAYRDNLFVDDVLGDLRKYADEYASYNVQYIYVVRAQEGAEEADLAGDSEGQLVGVLPLRDLVLARKQKRISDLMISDPLSVSDSMPLNDLKHLFDTRPLFGLPVVDADGMLVGVVRRSDMEEASEEQAGRTFLKFAGILGGEELRSLPLSVRSARRLSWLSLNIVLNVVAASVIAMYEETLAAVIALAVFLPMVSDMSGCSGNQAVAVSTRELVLGVIRPRDWLYVFRKEFALGVVNGIALGILLGIVAWIWKGMPALGLVVGGALAANTLVAVCLGSLIPLTLKGIKLDPALASGPILTTLTDMCGFFLVLSFAQLMLPWLVG